MVLFAKVKRDSLRNFPTDRGLLSSEYQLKADAFSFPRLPCLSAESLCACGMPAVPTVSGGEIAVHLQQMWLANGRIRGLFKATAQVVALIRSDIIVSFHSLWQQQHKPSFRPPPLVPTMSTSLAKCVCGVKHQPTTESGRLQQLLAFAAYLWES